MSHIGNLLRQRLAEQPTVEPEAPPKPPFGAKVLMHPSNMALLAYWRLTRGVKTLPAWAQIDLLEISEHLKNLIMVEWRNGASPVIRFAGPDIVAWTGLEPTSHTLKDIFGRDLCAGMPKEAEALRKVECLLLLQMKYETREGRSVLLEKLCMPLCDEKGGLRYLLIGCQWMSGTLAHGDRPDAILPKSALVTQKIMLPPEASNCPVEVLDPIRRHPWVMRTSSVA